MPDPQIIPHKIGIVVVGTNHNPSILNPDFLRHYCIVPETMKPVGPVISTPAFSQVVYQGLEIVSEPNRISFTEDIADKADIISPGAIKRYLRIVPLVHYTAMGVNLTAHVDKASAQWSPSELLKSAPWMRFEDVAPESEVQLIYKLGERIVNLTIKTEFAPTQEAKEFIVFHANFHRNIQAGHNESHMVASSMVEKWETDMKDFCRLSGNIAQGMKK